MVVRAVNVPPDINLKCHPKEKAGCCVCIICDAAYHKSDINRKKCVYISKNIIVCDEHPQEVDCITSKLGKKNNVYYPGLLVDQKITPIILAEIMLDRAGLNREIELLAANVEELRAENEELKNRNSCVNQMQIVNEGRSYADMTGRTRLGKKSTLIVKARDGKVDVLSEVKETLSGIRDVKVEKVIGVKENVTVIKFSNEKDRDRTRSIMEQSKNEQFDLKIQELKSPRIKIVGIENDHLRGVELQDDIIGRNLDAGRDSLVVLHTYVNKKNNTLSAICEVKKETYSKIMRDKRLYVGWQRCVVYDEFDINRCFNCCGYNHSKSKCRNRKACKRCGGEHDVKDCNAEQLTCVNCKYIHDKYQTNIDVNHAADDISKCHTYVNKLRRHVDNTDYPYIPESAKSSFLYDSFPISQSQ